MLADGRLHLTGIGTLAPHLTDENCAALLARAAHKSKRQIEELLVEYFPKPDVPIVVRKLPEPKSVELGPDRVANLPALDVPMTPPGRKRQLAPVGRLRSRQPALEE